MPEERTQQPRHPHLSRLKNVLSITSSALTGIFIASVIVIVLITIPLTTLVYSLDPRLSVIPVVVCLLLCFYMFSKERQFQDMIETAQTVGSSFVQSTVRKVVDDFIESVFETYLLFPAGVAVLGVFLITYGHTSAGTFLIALAVVGLAILTCCCITSRFLASKLLDLYLGKPDESSESTPLLD